MRERGAIAWLPRPNSSRRVYGRTSRVGRAGQLAARAQGANVTGGERPMPTFAVLIVKRRLDATKSLLDGGEILEPRSAAVESKIDERYASFAGATASGAASGGGRSTRSTAPAWARSGWTCPVGEDLGVVRNHARLDRRLRVARLRMERGVPEGVAGNA